MRRALLVLAAIATLAVACGSARHPSVCYESSDAMTQNVDDSDAVLAAICSGTSAAASPTSTISVQRR